MTTIKTKADKEKKVKCEKLVESIIELLTNNTTKLTTAIQWFSKGLLTKNEINTLLNAYSINDINLIDTLYSELWRLAQTRQKLLNND